VVKFAGRLDAPGMISLPYSPKHSSGNASCISVVDQQNPCLDLFYSKFGLPSDHPEARALLDGTLLFEDAQFCTSHQGHPGCDSLCMGETG